jgi:hypothetical protein
MNPYQFRISLRLRHPSRDLSVATGTFHLKPQHSWVDGGRRSTPSGDRLEGLYQGSYWTARLLDGEMCDSRNLTLDEALEKCWRSLAPHQSFLDELRRDGGSAEFYLGIFASENFGIVVSQQLLNDLASLGVQLAFDVYP